MKIDGSISARTSLLYASLGFDETGAMELSMMLQRPLMGGLQGYHDHDDVDDAVGALGVKEDGGEQEMDADNDGWWDEENLISRVNYLSCTFPTEKPTNANMSNTLQ